MNEMKLNGEKDISTVKTADGKVRLLRTDSLAKSAGQSALCLMRTHTGECFTAPELGIPWFDEILELPVSFLDVAVKIIREKLELVQNVDKVEKIKLKSNGRNINGSFFIKCSDDSTVSEEF